MSNAGNRSNYSLLPFEIRYLIATLLHDGATLETVAAHPDVRSAYARVGLEPTRSSLGRVKSSKEYRMITSKRESEMRSYAEERLARVISKEIDAAGAIGDAVQVDLLELIRQCTEQASADPKEVERLARAAANLTNPAKDAQIAKLKKELFESKKEIETVKTELKNKEASALAKLAEKDLEIAELRARCGAGGSDKVIAEMDRYVKGE